MKNAYTRNGVTVSVDHVEGKKLPCLLLSFEGEPEIYKVAAFKDFKTARWFLEVMEEFFKAMPAPGGEKWISVEDHLPDEGRYLVLTTPSINSGEPFARILRFSENLESVDRYDFEGINRSGWYYYDDEYGNIEVVTVTHWMPLPQPPKEDPHAES